MQRFDLLRQILVTHIFDLTHISLVGRRGSVHSPEINFLSVHLYVKHCVETENRC